MRKYVLKRILISIVILFFVSFIIYGLMRCLPTSYIERMAQQKAMAPGSKSYEEWLAQLEEMYHMNGGIISGFFAWMGEMFTGNFGDSWLYTVPVLQKFNDTVWLSFIMGGIAFILEIIIAIPLGVLAATKQYSRTDYAISVFALAGISLPTFFFASLLKLVFSVKLGWFDLYGLTGRFFNSMTPLQQAGDIAYHMVLPIITLMMLSIGGLMRYTRTNMLEVLNSDYIRTARAKGLSEKVVVNKHAFRNTLIPLVSYMSYLLPSMFGGALITETLYQIPGIGFVAYQAIVRGDIPFAMFYTTFQIILTQVSLLLADIMYAVVDPRVRVN